MRNKTKFIQAFRNWQKLVFAKRTNLHKEAYWYKAQSKYANKLFKSGTTVDEIVELMEV